MAESGKLQQSGRFTIDESDHLKYFNNKIDSTSTLTDYFTMVESA